MTGKREALITALQETQAEISRLLASVADRQDWQPAPDEWSFRYIAAHMATVEQDCMLERVHRIAAGEQPHFDYYLNTGWDFSQYDLNDSLHSWKESREACFDFVRSLPEEKLALTGSHASYGTITVLDVMQIMLDHDREHLEELQAYVNGQ